MKRNTWLTLIPAMLVLLLVGNVAMAQDGTGIGTAQFSAGFAIGLAALGGTLSQGNAARATYESIARNPQAADKISTPFFIGMALIESLVIFAWVMCLFILGVIGG